MSHKAEIKTTLLALVEDLHKCARDLRNETLSPKTIKEGRFIEGKCVGLEMAAARIAAYKYE